MPKHPFTWTRKAPMGQRDPSVAFCDDCGERVEAEIHQGAPQADYDREVIALIGGSDDK
jgi:hypothetical protein